MRGRAYEAGDVARTSPSIAKSVELEGCLERGYAVYDGGTTHPKSLVVLYSFGNACDEAVPIDLARASVHVYGRSTTRDDDALNLYRKDPYAEIGPRRIDARAWASERIRYHLPVDVERMRRVCVCAHGCASANDALAQDGSPGVTCFDPAHEAVAPSERVDPGWLEPRWRGESPRSRRCRNTGRGERHYVVGESPCTEFGEFWSVEGQTPIVAQLSFGVQRVPTFASIANDSGAHTSGETLTLGEVGVQVFWQPSPYLYMGGGFGVGFGAGPDDTVVVPRGDSGTSVTTGSIALQPILGARIPLGVISMRVEVVTPLRAVGILGPTDPSTQKRQTLDYGMASVVPRLGIDLWLDRRASIGLVGGADVVHVPGATVALVFAAHGRAHDGKR